MNVDAYQYNVDDDMESRVRVISLDGEQRIRISLPVDEKQFLKSLPYAEKVCSDLSGFLKAFETYKEEQKQENLRLYAKKRAKIYQEFAKEIDQLRIELVAFNSPKKPNHAEVTFHDLPSTERAWICGYADGAFYGLSY